MPSQAGGDSGAAHCPAHGRPDEGQHTGVGVGVVLHIVRPIEETDGARRLRRLAICRDACSERG